MISTWDKHVRPHGKLNRLADNLWQVTGSLPRGNMPRNMIVYRFPNNQLWIHSAVALDKPTITELETLGTPSWLVVPNGFHRLDAAVYKARYPAMKVVCPRAARARVAKAVAVDADAEDALPPLGVVCHAPPGIRPSELVYELPVEGGQALVVCDLFFNLRNLRGLDGWLFRKLGSTGFFGITGFGKLLLLKDKLAFRAWIDTLAARSDIRVITVGHGETITQNASTRLAEAAARLA